MFWKRKGKKQDGDAAAAESGGVSTATVDEERAETAAPAESAESEQPKAGTEAGAAGSEPVETADAAGTGEDGEEDTASDAAAGEEADAAPAEPERGGAGDGSAEDSAIRLVRTAGVLHVDGEEVDVVSNTWIVQADDEGVIVIDPAHDAAAVLEAVGDREIYLVACTNGYNTHIGAAVEVAARDESPIALHPRELRAWRKVHGIEHRPDMEVEGGGHLEVGDLELEVLPTPGTSSGSVSYYIPELGAVFSGDILLAGRLGTVGEGYVDYTTQLASVGEILLSLPPDTRVLPDSGEETTVAAESKNFDDWVSAD
ncbi:MBL fold metallo-hydrolase [Marinitenerispora sediminis]|uniref:Zn-dependent hydrolase n=1 Tax=Marinitenerispora sediminis TaxID=1931232 RepID=A0A368SZZ2_9ACTN|nr:MBL fold metallo-hydrolase [Marinitenerispora sediminis]RCV50537.1 Zn-dependent hydrolase [Marinitenerispora sediminis]RCV51744.1 Zn-dependent hydrolase [Marinitenerispora sediminis]RCV59385.1 Zn-dependent hydrolase [Marinitenerispora sediminis]